MTMQTTTLPFQVSGASALAQPQRNAAAGVQAPEGGQFSATLSRAMAPTMAPSPAPTPAPAASSNKPAASAKQADKPAAQGPKAAAREPAKQNDTASDAPATAQQAGGTESGEPAKDAAAAESASAAAEAATTPVTDMLAFMASLMQPAAQAAAAPAAAEAVATVAGAAELQLGALQSAFAKLETADGAATADPALAAAAEGDAAGFALATGVQPTAQESADLRAQQQTVVPADPGKAQPQLRDSAAYAAAKVEPPAPSVTQLQAQVAKLDTLPNPAAVPGDRIPARVGTQAWDNQVSQRIVYMVGKEQAATLTLNPPDLGPVQVVLSVSNDGASVAFSSNQQEVRQALENALPRLREMMGESGIALGNATVDAGMPDGRQAQQDGERRHAGGGGLGNAGAGVAANEDGAARPATRTVSLGDNGLVDTFA